MKVIRGYLEYFLIAVILGGLFVFVSFSFRVTKPVASYATKLFNQNLVHRVEIEINENDLENLYLYPGERTKYHANVAIDGEEIKDVSFSTRGNGSLGALVADETTDRYGFKIDFGKFQSGQNYLGLDELILNNLFDDPSMMRDFMAFTIMNSAGVETPLFAYTELYINDELKGLYLAVEEVDQSFLRRTNSSPDAVAYKPQPLIHNHNKRREMQKQLGEGGELVFGDTWLDSEGIAGANLKYRGEKVEHYTSVFDNALTKISPKDKEQFVRSTEALRDNFNVEKYWQMDEIIKYFAAHVFIISDDSYIGTTSQNYILKISDGKNSIIPWDYNYGFIHLWADGAEQTGDNVITWDIDAPLFGELETNDRPLWKVVAENPEYLEKYHSELQKLLDNFLANGEVEAKINETFELIRPYVERDPTKFYDTETFVEGVEYLKRFVYWRTDSVQKQLWGAK